MRRTRNAKIVATLGPASSDKDTVRQLFLAGVDVFRLNFSHGSHDDHRARFNALRELEQETGRPIAILADLQGPKLRVGVFANGPVQLVEGAAFRLDLDTTPGTAERVGLPVMIVETMLGRAALPIGVVVDPVRSRAYVAISGGDRVAVIDTRSWNVVDRWPAGREPDALGFVSGD